MPQLPLFEGSHLPRTAAREALARGELGEARAQLAQRANAAEDTADAARLERIVRVLRAPGEDAAETVHRAFASALAETEPRGFLSTDEWFSVYARSLARVLAAEPGRCFRGWPSPHFAFVAGDPRAAERAAEQWIAHTAPGPAWIEAARIAFALGEATRARAWIHAACLDSAEECAAAAPALEPCGVPELDAQPPLPALPARVENVFDTARVLEGLPGPSTRWVAVVGEIDRVLGPPDPRAGAPVEDLADDGDPPRAFLAALRAARRSRERDRARSPEHCSDRELRARRRMQRIAPALLARYLQVLRGSLL